MIYTGKNLGPIESELITKLSIYNRLSTDTKTSPSDIMRMRALANEISQLAPLLVQEAESRRMKMLAELGVYEFRT